MKYKKTVCGFIFNNLLLLVFYCGLHGVAHATDSMQLVDDLIASHPQQDGAFVLETGEQSLLSRAWLVHNARQTIDVQYFIWSTDNIGILAAEALLQAAERGVRVRVIVDDLLVDASEESLLALAAHRNIHIKIYNPKHSVGTTFWGRIRHLFSDFYALNQRMHDKALLIDGQLAITGGRNMADEYFDYDQKYNFRDRDVLLIGPVVAEMSASFERFWQSDLAVSVQDLLHDRDVLNEQQVAAHYAELHSYAADTNNFSPQVRAAIDNLAQEFAELVDMISWTRAIFISDDPGKNAQASFSGGGNSTRMLVDLLQQAQRSVIIQSPYLVMPEGGLEIFEQLINRGVRVIINTNSLSSTDNLMAYSGYSKQREQLLKAGIDIYEFKPFPEIQQTIMHRFNIPRQDMPVFAIHAKTMVIDNTMVFIGTFNFDPRSANLNTEVGVVLKDAELAQQVTASIVTDMATENSWQAATENPDQYASWLKRFKLFWLRLLPLDPVL